MSHGVPGAMPAGATAANCPDGGGKQITVQRFGFDSASEAPGRRLIVHIPQVMDADYGMYVWKCGFALAHFVWRRGGELAGKRFVELGAGTALPGVVAALVGASVTLTDRANKAGVLERCVASCLANGLEVFDGEDATLGRIEPMPPGSVRVLGVTWGEFTPPLLALLQCECPDVVLAADCFYEKADLDDFVATLFAVLSSRAPGRVEVWMTYQDRASNRALQWQDACVRWSLRCERVALAAFMPSNCRIDALDADGTVVGMNMDSVEMHVITLQGA